MSEAEYARIRRQATRLSARLLEYQPQTTAAFGNLHKAAMTDAVLGPGIRELIAVQTPYQPRVALHVPAALRHGTTPAEIRALVSASVMTGGGPALACTAHPIGALEQAIS